MKNEDLFVYKKSDFYEDFISSQKEYYEREQVDTLLTEKDREIALLKERIANGDVSRITWIDEVIELKQKLQDHCSHCPVKEQEEDVVADLKAKLHDAEMRADLAEAANTEYRLDIEKIKAENERLKNELKHSEDELESYFIFEKEIKQKLRATRRALYKACVNWAHFAIAFFSQYSTKEKWYKMKLKCQKKAEEYK